MSDIVRLSLLDAHAPSDGFRPVRRNGSPGTAAPAEPVSSAEPDAYATGYADGQQAASEVFAREHAAMAKLLSAASALQPEPSEELAAMMALTVERLVSEVVGSADVDAAWLMNRCRSAAALIVEADAARTLWLNPDDLALIEGVELGAIAMADPALERGALRIECSAGWIEDGRSIHLDALRAELGMGAIR